jgi:hypothetical protein
MQRFSNAQDTVNKDFKEYNDLLYVAGTEIQNDSLQLLNLIVPIQKAKPSLLIWGHLKKLGIWVIFVN